MKSFLTPLITGWLPRQLLKVLTPLATVIGATSESTAQTVAFLTAGIAFLLELVLSWFSRRWMAKQAGVKVQPVKIPGALGLLLLVGICLTSLPACTMPRGAWSPFPYPTASPYQASGEQAYWDAQKAAAEKEADQAALPEN